MAASPLTIPFHSQENGMGTLQLNRTGSVDSPQAMRRILTPEQRHHDDFTWNYLPVSLSSDYFSLSLDFKIHILPLVRPNWSSDLLRYRVFEDGLSNKLVGFFQVDKPDDESVVLVRVNGKGRNIFVDERMEILVMLTLHRAGLSPPLYLVTKNAMCYGYIPGQSLRGSEMQTQEVLEATANALARFHSVPLPRALQVGKPRVWSQVDNWIELVRDDFHDDCATQRFKEVIGSLEGLRREMEWLKALLGAPNEKKMNGVSNTMHISDFGLTSDGHPLACDSVCVLCHNDPQPLNFVRTPCGELLLIDMEFSGINYPAFDIADFFCEFAGAHGTVDYSRYPSEAVQKKWISHYLAESARLKGMDPGTITPAHVHRLYRDANQFALVAHFMWTLWSLIQYSHSIIQFDYLEYGFSRYTEYKKRKSIVLSISC